MDGRGTSPCHKKLELVVVWGFKFTHFSIGCRHPTECLSCCAQVGPFLPFYSLELLSLLQGTCTYHAIHTSPSLSPRCSSTAICPQPESCSYHPSQPHTQLSPCWASMKYDHICWRVLHTKLQFSKKCSVELGAVA